MNHTHIVQVLTWIPLALWDASVVYRVSLASPVGNEDNEYSHLYGIGHEWCGSDIAPLTNGLR